MNKKVSQIFDNNKILLHRQRAASKILEHDFLICEVANRINQRLHDISGDFSSILNIGANIGQLSTILRNDFQADLLVNHDMSENMLKQSATTSVVSDCEKLPFKNKSFDLITSCLSLHFINDLPMILTKIRKMLKKDGVFIASLYGLGTLKELKQIFTEVEMQETAGASMRISPFVEIKTFGQLIQNVGFSQPVVDAEEIKVSYENIMELMRDLRGMGESAAFVDSAKPLNKDIIYKMDSLYKEKFPDDDGGIIASFNIITITGLAAINE